MNYITTVLWLNHHEWGNRVNLYMPWPIIAAKVSFQPLQYGVAFLCSSKFCLFPYQMPQEWGGIRINEPKMKISRDLWLTISLISIFPSNKLCDFSCLECKILNRYIGCFTWWLSFKVNDSLGFSEKKLNAYSSQINLL